MWTKGYNIIYDNGIVKYNQNGAASFTSIRAEYEKLGNESQVSHGYKSWCLVTKV